MADSSFREKPLSEIFRLSEGERIDAYRDEKAWLTACERALSLREDFSRACEKTTPDDPRIDTATLTPQTQGMIREMLYFVGRTQEMASELYLTTTKDAVREETREVVDRIMVESFSPDKEVIDGFHNALYLSTKGGKVTPPMPWESRGLMYEFNTPEGRATELETITMLSKVGFVRDDYGSAEGSILTVIGQAVLKRLDELHGPSEMQREAEETVQHERFLSSPRRAPGLA